MAAGTQTRLAVGLDIYDDHRHFDSGHFRDSTSSPTALSELPLSNIQNIGKPAIDSLADELNNFHITPTKENFFEEQHQTQGHGRKARPHVEFDTFQGPLATHHEEVDAGENNRKASGVSVATSSKTEVDFRAVEALEASLRDIPSNAEQLAKHQAGQWEWVVELPLANRKSDSARDGRPFNETSRVDTNSPHEGEQRLLFGCNLLRRKAPDQSGKGKGNETTNVYTILATLVEEPKPVSVHETQAAEEMSMISTTQADTTIIRMASPQMEETPERRTSEVALSAKNDDIVEQLRVLPPARPVSRIEDSVEALDKLEEQLEAVNEVTRLERVLSPEEVKGVAEHQKIDTSLKRTGSTVQKTGTSTVRVRSTVERSSSLRKSASMSFSHDEEKTTSTTKAPRKSLVMRPASLLPPKPPAKSSKPPTVPTFQLTGEVVAQRLKAQREARLSKQITPEQAAAAAAAYSPSKPHVKSTKPPTRPTFELPGDAISRRKREEREAKLRQQEEEERKRREFKARPLRTSMVATTYVPRETIASRARQSKVAVSEGATATPRAATTKRHSMAAAPTPRTSTGTGTVRGRSQLTVDSAAGTSRATSTSTGSMHGGDGAGSVVSVSKRSTVSAEDQQHQKVRGREIFVRDNSLTAERERERREKEMATKLARKEAAERSRQLSREWAEKQRLKRMSTAGSSA